MNVANTNSLIRFAKRLVAASMLVACCTFVSAQVNVANNILLFQRSIGGWPKQFNGQKINYSQDFSEQQKKEILAQVNKQDATIDNHATVKEIRILLDAYKKHNKTEYLQAAEKGIKYLLVAQYKNGGWPQYFPDFSLYRGQVTYNDNAMVNVLNLLQDIVEQTKNTEVVNPAFIPQAQIAIDKGVDCILATQIKVKDKPTGWCAQYDQHSLKPATARKYELPSISGMETVYIVEFLMRQPKPSKEIIASVEHAINWLDAAAIRGYEGKIIADASQPKGKDRVLVPSENSVTWARFYDIETNQPFFSGRDGEKKKKLEEIEVERRAGYAWYGSWPQDLLEKDYPKWKRKNAEWIGARK